jgi:transposase
MTKSRKKPVLSSEPFKLEVLRDYYLSGSSKSSISLKWGIDRSTLHCWLKRYPLESELLSLPAEIINLEQMKKEEQSAEACLKEENLRLRKALAMERLRSSAFEKLIEIAEKEEKISI